MNATNKEVLEKFAHIKSGPQGTVIEPRRENVDRWVDISNEIQELLEQREIHPMEAYFLLDFLLQHMQRELGLPFERIKIVQ